jgi:hypothetical protein
MGVTHTASDPAVALYDSVSGYAFGEVFTNADDAESFLAYANEHESRDLRILSAADLEKLRKAWADATRHEERVDESSDAPVRLDAAAYRRRLSAALDAIGGGA